MSAERVAEQGQKTEHQGRRLPNPLAQVLGLFHRTKDTQPPAEAEITEESVGKKLRDIQLDFTSGHPANQFDPESAELVRKALSLTRVQFNPNSRLIDEPIISASSGLDGFKISEACSAANGSFYLDPNTTFDHISVLLEHNSVSGLPSVRIKAFMIKDLSGNSLKIEGYELRDRVVCLGLLNTLSATILPRAPDGSPKA